MLGEFRSCGSDHGLCPLDSHKPLKRLDRNFKCFCAVTFVSLIGFCAMLQPRRLAIFRFAANLMPPPPKKIKTTLCFHTGSFILFAEVTEQLVKHSCLSAEFFTRCGTFFCCCCILSRYYCDGFKLFIDKPDLFILLCAGG